jgi:hypothetical protein
MKTFYEMMQILEDDQEQQGPEQGLGNEAGPEQGGEEQSPAEAPEQSGRKHYMFFSNLKAIKGMVEEMMAMDAAKVDEMLADGHDWAADHVATSKDDIEEVYNWLAGEMSEAS